MFFLCRFIPVSFYALATLKYNNSAGIAMPYFSYILVLFRNVAVTVVHECLGVLLRKHGLWHGGGKICQNIVMML